MDDSETQLPEDKDNLNDEIGAMQDTEPDDHVRQVLP
jgi:hypothetical protein